MAIPGVSYHTIEGKYEMYLGPRRIIIGRILTESLSRIRRFGDLGEEKFSASIRDLPRMLRVWAKLLDEPPEDFEARPELPEFEGYSSWAESYDQSDQNPVIAGEEEGIWDIIGDVRGIRVLDVGCGTGRHALPMAANGATVVGLDPTPEMLDRARQKADAKGLNLDLRQGSIDDLAPSLGTYDLVLCCLVLSHVPDLSAATERLASHVRAGGRLIITDFHPFNILLGFRTQFESGGKRYVVPNYLHLPSSYFNAISNAGLEVTKLVEPGEIPKVPSLPMTLVIEAIKHE